MDSAAQLRAIVEALQTSEVNIADLLISLLDLCTPLMANDLSQRIPQVLDAFLNHATLGDAVLAWSQTVVKRRLASAVKSLSRKENGWHFSALRATPEKLSNFEMEVMADDIQDLALELWDAVGCMLRAQDMSAAVSANMDEDMDEEEKACWATQDDVGLLDNEGRTTGQNKVVQREARQQSLIQIKQVVMISIMMQSVNQQCNALQSIIGVFLHSCDTPEKVIKTLSRAGMSISHDAINRAVKSLSIESTKGLVALGQTLLASYAYDNFDVQLHVGMPTVEEGVSSNLIHLTSGDLLQLEHGVSTDDLKCSRELWESSPYNEECSSPYPRHISLKSTSHLQRLHPESEHVSGQSRRARFNAWQFLYDLCHHGPEYFHQFRKDVGEPEAVEKIPVKKLHHVPARAMDINQSTVSGNKDAIANLLAQGGVGDPNEDDGSGYENNVVDMTEHVILVHGDLGTCERVQSVLERRSAEATPWRRYQYVVFIMGLFHLKMATADALWRIFIAKADAREDANALMSFVEILRPNETGKIGSTPEFRQMHEVIRHTGIALRLDAWRTTVSRRDKKMKSLEDYAASKPSWDQIVALSLTLNANFIAGDEQVDLFLERRKRHAERDQQLENMALLQQYALLYEELTYAMNAGDIGRVETLFPPWIMLFRATGKHKYANQMVQFLTDLHYRYPEGLRRAIQYNILVNPTGRPNSFRAVDWIVELNNLFTKVIYGGSGSNFTKDRIITESPLIQIYRNCHANIEKNFRLGGLSSVHAAKDMRETFKKLCAYMKENKTNEYKRSRKTAYQIIDMLEKGLAMEDMSFEGEDEEEYEWDDIEPFLGGITADDLSADAPLA